MSKLILSTGNIVSGGPSIVRRPGDSRSNLELTNSLRSNFDAAQHDIASPSPTASPTSSDEKTASAAASPRRPSVSLWTAHEHDTLFVPRIDWSAAGLAEEPSHYDITAKLFFLPTAPVAGRAHFAREALDLVLRELCVPVIDLLIVSFPGMSFEGDCEWEADKANASQGNDDDEAATWAGLEPLRHDGKVKRLGLAEFGSDKLARFLRAVQVRPAVDQINIRDCCNVPPPLAQLAKDEGIELLVHSDCTDILPKGTLRELLGPGPAGAGVLADVGGKEEDGGLRGDLNPRWVIKYTAVVTNRGVIENKGYFACAELAEAQLP